MTMMTMTMTLTMVMIVVIIPIWQWMINVTTPTSNASLRGFCQPSSFFGGLTDMIRSTQRDIPTLSMKIENTMAIDSRSLDLGVR